MINYNTGKEDWDAFVSRHSLDGGFLQSWNWGEFQKSSGKKIWRLALIKDNEIEMAALIIRQPLKFGFGFFYVPRGPVSRTMDIVRLRQSMLELAGEMERLAKEEKSVFLRVEPAWTTELVNQYFFSEQGFVQSLSEIQPKHTLILDLVGTPEQILLQMKPKTRYNIGLAERHDVKVVMLEAKSGPVPPALESFYQLLIKTTQRQIFRTHGFHHFSEMWSRFGQAADPANSLRLFTALHDNKPVAAILVSFFKETAIYLHGGADNSQRNLMAPHLIQWAAIQEAKKFGCLRYDFWGVAPEEGNLSDKEQGWAGITRFKAGFAPQSKTIEYTGPYEWPVKTTLYKAYRLAKSKKWI